MSDSGLTVLLRHRIREAKEDMMKMMEEKLYMSATTIKVGDRVEAPRHGRGTVLAIVGDNAWVQTEVRDYPLTFDIKKLKPVPKPRVSKMFVIEPITDVGGGFYAGGWYSRWEVDAVELTDEVRERLKDLL